jgi:hypothetical protein
MCGTHDDDVENDFERSVRAEISKMVVCQILLSEQQNKLCVYSRFTKRYQSTYTLSLGHTNNKL